ncbi:AlkA N-terminal domain-containing protein, partial [Streptomyces alkaliphilus]
ELREDEALRGDGPGSGDGNDTAGGRLPVLLRLTDHRDLTAAVQRVRRLFDLDADPFAVTERLGDDPLFAEAVRLRPGLRSPGAVDPVEVAARAGTPRGRGAARRRAGIRRRERHRRRTTAGPAATDRPPRPDRRR